MSANRACTDCRTVITYYTYGSILSLPHTEISPNVESVDAHSQDSYLPWRMAFYRSNDKKQTEYARTHTPKMILMMTAKLNEILIENVIKWFHTQYFPN